MFDLRKWCLACVLLASVLLPEIANAAELRLYEISLDANGTKVVAPVLIVDDRPYVTAEIFEQLRIERPSGPVREFQGDRYHALDGHLGSEYQIDDGRQAIALSVPTQHLIATRLTQSDQPEVEPAVSGLGGFANYDVLGEYFSESDDYVLGGAFEVGLYAGGVVATSNHVVRDATHDAEHVRLETSVVRDVPDVRLTLRLGDSISRGGQWGRPVRFGGVQVGTNFATQPYFVTFPTAVLSGDAALPSSVDLLVNDSQRFSADVPAGPFSIENVPLVTGAGEVTAVVRDVLGRETVISQPYYASPSLLREDLHDFSFELGSLRERFGSESNSYDDQPFSSATYRYGWNDNLTTEAHAEVDPDRGAIGISVATPLGSLGVMSGSAAGSQEKDGGGGLFQIGFERVSRGLNVTASGRLATGDYEDLGVDDNLSSPTAETRFQVGFPLGGWGNLSSSHTFQAFDDEEDTHVVSSSYSVGIGRIGRLNLTALSTFGRNEDTLVSLNLTVPLGVRSSASATLQASREREELLKTATAQTTAPLEGGFGARAEVSDNGFTRARGELSYTSQYGVTSAAVSQIDGDTGARLNAVGGMAVADGDVFLSRRLDNSFAVASVPDQPNVRVYYENQLVGRTDSDGQLLIHSLRPYEANKVSIEPLDLPFDAQVDRTTATVAPYFRSGVTVEFPVGSSRTVLLSVYMEDGTPVPSGAIASLEGASDRFPVGLDGEVQLWGVQEDARVVVDTGDGLCEFLLDIELPDAPMPDLGAFTCRRRAR